MGQSAPWHVSPSVPHAEFSSTSVPPKPPPDTTIVTPRTDRLEQLEHERQRRQDVAAAGPFCGRSAETGSCAAV